MNIYHGIVVEKSLNEGAKVEDIFDVIRTMKDSSWGIKLVSVDAEKIEEKAKELQNAMKDENWYAHFYDVKDSLIVVFKTVVYKVGKSPSTWDEVVRYGRSIDIPQEQLDFIPRNLEDEDEYFEK